MCAKWLTTHEMCANIVTHEMCATYKRSFKRNEEKSIKETASEVTKGKTARKID